MVQLAHAVKSVTQLLDESVVFEGQPVPCYVLDIVYEKRGAVRLWIDQRRHWVLREALDAQNWTLDITSIKIKVNQPPPQWLVQFALMLVGRELTS